MIEVVITIETNLLQDLKPFSLFTVQRMKFKYLILLFMMGLMGLLFLSCGCPYGFTVNTLPSHIKTIAIPTFENQTDLFGIEEELTQIIVREFESNGLRIRNSLEDVDAILEGTLSSYSKDPSSYDEAGLIQEYKVTFRSRWSFRDLKFDQELSRGGSQGWETYAVDDGEGDTIEKEEDARQTAMEMLAEEIAVKVLQNW